jgi:hypothetical protein
MNQERWSRWEKILIDHPLCFRNALGFECHDGWLDIIEKALDQLEDLIDEQEEDSREFCHVTQIKEKHGYLHIYMGLATEIMMRIIEKAENESLEICEICGKEGKFIKDWAYKRVRCKEHENV